VRLSAAPHAEVKPLETREKALAVNLDPRFYGTFAEIGAGQEVVRWFFRVGGAAGTIAKSISAYDMSVSDTIYGKSDRYVSRSRLEAMLDYEYKLNVERLKEARGETTAFFAFADTVSARNYKGTNEQHGWMGVKFQARPREEPSRIILHVRMLDKDNAAQSEALGVIGVNLLYGAFFHGHEPDKLIESIEFSGAEFRAVDNRVASLELVQLGLSDAAMFGPNGAVLQPSEVLYKRPVLVERGSFRPVTHVNMDMLRCAREEFGTILGKDSERGVELVEITMKNLLAGGTIDYQDFLARADLISAAGKTVLISDYFEYYRLVGYLQRYTKLPIGIVLGAGSLVALLGDEVSAKLESELQGGILEALGRLFRNGTRLFVYPWRDAKTEALMTVENLEVPADAKSLYAYLVERGSILPLKNYNPDYLRIFSRDVARRIQEGDASWERDVPSEIADVIKKRGFLGYKQAH
jgi:hypothetical protein